MRDIVIKLSANFKVGDKLRIRWAMSFKDMIEYCKQGGKATRFSWFRSDAAVRYIQRDIHNNLFYVGHFPTCTVMSGDGSYENEAIDEDRNADDWVIMTDQELKKWEKAFEDYCGCSPLSDLKEDIVEAFSLYQTKPSPIKEEQSLIASVIDNGLMDNHIGNSSSFDKEIK